MRQTLFLLSFTLIIVACYKKDLEKASSEDSYQSVDSLTLKHEDSRAIDQVRKFDVLLLQGVWWLDVNDVSALFKIEGDSLYYTEEMSSPYLIKVDGDLFWMTRENHKSDFKIKVLTKDSLVLYDKNINENISLTKKR